MSSSARVVCPQCGSNNFDTVTSCWKCGAGLSRGVAVPAPGAPYAAKGGGESTGSSSWTGAATPTRAGNPKAANAAAIALGLLMPYFGLAIGLGFMMFDDRRRQEVGRICLLWSILSSALHVLFFFLAVLSMRTFLGEFLAGLQSSRGGAVPGGSGMGIEP